MKKYIYILILFAFLSLQSTAQTFTNLNWELPTGQFRGSVVFADFDGDGDLDMYYTDFGSKIGGFGRLYRNNAGIPELVSDSMPVADEGSVVCCDFDNNGIPDLFVTGNFMIEAKPVVYLKGLGNMQFAPVQTNIPNFIGYAKAVDYNNDGWQDLFISGWIVNGKNFTGFFRNNHGHFDGEGFEIPGNSHVNADFGDIDGDGDFDMAYTGYLNENSDSTGIYVNEMGIFKYAKSNLKQLITGEIKFSDFDNDGDLDILNVGMDPDGFEVYSIIYLNDGKGNFSKSDYELTGVGEPGTCDIGDIDADGYPDILLSGTYLLRNNNAEKFDDISDVLIKNYALPARFADWNGDRRLDAFLVRIDGGFSSTSMYKNEYGKQDIPPEPPMFKKAEIIKNSVRLSWTPAFDLDGAKQKYTFAVRLGTTPGGVDIVSPLSDSESGYRKVVAAGNAGNNLFYIINNLKPGKYYWSVQSIDNSYVGSTFAGEGSFEISTTGVETASEQTIGIYPNPVTDKFTLTFNDHYTGCVKIDLTDEFGNNPVKLYDENINGNYISFETVNLSAGVYLLRIYIDGRTEICKLMKK